MSFWRMRGLLRFARLAVYIVTLDEIDAQMCRQVGDAGSPNCISASLTSIGMFLTQTDLDT